MLLRLLLFQLLMMQLQLLLMLHLLPCRSLCHLMKRVLRLPYRGGVARRARGRNCSLFESLDFHQHGFDAGGVMANGIERCVHHPADQLGLSLILCLCIFFVRLIVDNGDHSWHDHLVFGYQDLPYESPGKIYGTLLDRGVDGCTIRWCVEGGRIAYGGYDLIPGHWPFQHPVRVSGREVKDRKLSDLNKRNLQKTT